jgi:hypothetical protein
VDSVPATRAFLIRLLQGWSVADGLVDSAALLTAGLMANALEHGAGLVSVGIALDGGLLHISVGDNAESRDPEVLPPDTDRDRGRDMWIVDVLAQDWGVAASPGGFGKTVWCEFELAVAPPPRQKAPRTGDQILSRVTQRASVSQNSLLESTSPNPSDIRLRYSGRTATTGDRDEHGLAADR